MNSATITTFDGEENMRSYVNRHNSGGFSVSVQDIDSGEFLSTIRIFKDFDMAVRYAKKAVAQNGQGMEDEIGDRLGVGR